MSLDERVSLDSDVWKIVRLHGIGLEQLDIYWHRAIQTLELRWKKHVFKQKRDAIASDLRREGYTVRMTGKLSGLEDMKRELKEKFQNLHSSEPTLRESAEATKIRVAKMSCRELYDSIIEARTMRNALTPPAYVFHFILTGYIHEATVELKRRCPEYYSKLIERYKGI